MKHFVIGVLLLSLAYFGLSVAPDFAYTVTGADQYPHVAAALNDQGARLTQYQIDGRIEIPWGDWLSEIIKALTIVVGAVAAWLLRKVPANITAALDMFAGMLGQGRVNELLDKAVTYGVNATSGAVKGKTLSVGVGNEVLERAFEYALRHAPGLVSKLGGMTILREKILARLELDADASLPVPKPAMGLTTKIEVVAPPAPPAAQPAAT